MSEKFEPSTRKKTTKPEKCFYSQGCHVFVFLKSKRLSKMFSHSQLDAEVETRISKFDEGKELEEHERRDY